MPSVLKVAGYALAVAAFLGVASSSAQEAGEVPMTRQQYQKMYLDFLAEEGYRPHIDEDGDVQFKREGRTYFIGVAGDDPQFFIVVLPNIWPIESEKERAQVLAAADAANARSKVSKVHTIADNVWVCVELFVDEPQDFKKVFGRGMPAIDGGLVIFVAKMREQWAEPD